MDKIDGLIELYEKRLSTLRELKALVSDDPTLAAEVVGALSAGSSPRSRGLGSGKVTQFSKLMEYLNDGQWRTLPEMADAVGAGKASLAPYLYRHDDLFESQRHPSKPRMMQWRMKGKATTKDGEP